MRNSDTGEYALYQARMQKYLEAIFNGTDAIINLIQIKEDLEKYRNFLKQTTPQKSNSGKFAGVSFFFTRRKVEYLDKQIALLETLKKKKNFSEFCQAIPAGFLDLGNMLDRLRYLEELDALSREGLKVLQQSQQTRTAPASNHNPSLSLFDGTIKRSAPQSDGGLSMQLIAQTTGYSDPGPKTSK